MAEKRRSRRWLRWLSLLALAGAALLAKGYWNATRDPVIRTAAVEVADWPAGQPPLKLLLLSDIHVAGPDMPPERLVRIVADLTQLKPDLVLIAGDLVSEKRRSEEHTSELQSLMHISSAFFCLKKKQN